MSLVKTIGPKLRGARKRSGFVIDDLAHKTGISRAFISQIENGKASPSLETIERMAEALNIPVASLFIDEQFRALKTRPDDRIILQLAAEAPDVRRKNIHLLTAPNRRLELVLMELPPDSHSGPSDEGHEGEEACYVLEGQLCVEVGEQNFDLKVGDSLHWDATLRHRLTNVGEEAVKLVFARTPPGFLNLLFSETAEEN